MELLDWLKLDNSAMLYPLLSTRKTQSLFRLSIYLKETIDKDTLERALIDIMPRFSSFNVRLRRGLFWYFLEKNTYSPRVFMDDGIVLKRINSIKNRHFLFTVLYYNERISIEFFHAITDGIAGAEFIKTLAFRYLELRGFDIEADANIIKLTDTPSLEEIEDSFIRCSDKQNLKEFIDKSKDTIKGDDAYRIRGRYYELPGYGIIEGIVSSESLLNTARSYGMTITSYLGAAFIMSVIKTANIKKFKPLTLMVPINLRGIFNSRTLRNFVLFTRAGIRDNIDDITLKDIAEAIERDIKADIDTVKLRNRISCMEYIEKMWLLRIIPLPIKYFFFKLFRPFVRKNGHTAILSNLGRINLPNSMLPYVDGIAININIAKNVPLSMGVASCAGKTRIMFTSLIYERDIEKEFFRILSNDGLNVTVISNLREDDRYVL